MTHEQNKPDELGAEPAGRAGSPYDVLEKAKRILEQATWTVSIGRTDASAVAHAYLELVENRGPTLNGNIADAVHRLRSALTIRNGRAATNLSRVRHEDIAIVLDAVENRGGGREGEVTPSNSVREETIEECAKVADDAKNAAAVMMAQTTEGPARYYLRSRGAEFAARKIGESIRALLSPTGSGSVGKGSAALSSEGEEG